jgi:hypothetical protein
MKEGTVLIKNTKNTLLGTVKYMICVKFSDGTWKDTKVNYKQYLDTKIGDKMTV